MSSLHLLRRIAKPTNSHSLFHHIHRCFANPKVVPQSAEISTPEVTLRTPQRAAPTPATRAIAEHSEHSADAALNDGFPPDENDENESREQDPDDSTLRSPFYQNLLNSKLGACPPQPLNETTKIIWGAVLDTVQRTNRVQLMSRWEQIQRGYVRPESIAHAVNHERRSGKYADSEYRRHHFTATDHRFADTVIDINDLLQMHHSLDDVARTDRTHSVRTLAKATGGRLDEWMGPCGRRTGGDHDDGEGNALEMRNDLKWKRRKMKLHIKKKRRDGLRMKKKAMRERNQEKQ